MTIRTTSSTMTFARPFLIARMNRELPAGSYPLETDEEALETVSASAWRRIEVRLFVPRIEGRSEAEMWVMSPAELDSAVSRDRLPAAMVREAPAPGPAIAQQAAPNLAQRSLAQRSAAFEKNREKIMFKLKEHGNAPLYGVCLGVVALLFASWIAHQIEPANAQAPAVQALVEN